MHGLHRPPPNIRGLSIMQYCHSFLLLDLLRCLTIVPWHLLVGRGYPALRCLNKHCDSNNYSQYGICNLILIVVNPQLWRIGRQGKKDQRLSSYPGPTLYCEFQPLEPPILAKILCPIGSEFELGLWSFSPCRPILQSYGFTTIRTSLFQLTNTQWQDAIYCAEVYM